MKNVLRSGAFVLVAASTVSAQDVTGRLNGRVLAEDNTPLREADVIVTSPILLGERAATTDARGRFLISSLPVGSYRAEIRRIGYQRLLIENISVRLGETVSLPAITLKPITVLLPDVIVGGDARAVDPNNTAQRIVLDASRLDALPLDRNFREIMLLAPSAVPSFLGRDGGGGGINRDGINVAGATGYENIYYVDGINITSPIRGETSIDLPYNFIQEMEVRTGGSTADDAQAPGGVVNIVTPSGGDRIRGQLFGFFSNDALETHARSAVGSYGSGFTFYDIGASISGPLIRDRLRFFGAFNENYERRNYTYSFGEQRTVRRQHLFAGKLTWRLGARTSGFLTVLGDPSRSEPLAMPLFGSGVPQNAEALRRKDEIGGVGVSARVQQLLMKNVLIEASVSQMTRDESGEPATAAGRAPVLIDYINGTVSGGHGFGYAFDSRRRTGRVDLSLDIPSHAVKTGVQLEELYGDITLDLARNSMGGTIERVGTNLYTWHWALGRNGRGTNRNPSVYIQDTWQPSPRLSVNAGLRWSRQLLKDAGSTSVFSRYRIIDGIQPRAGIVYQPGELGAQRVFAGYSRATEQLPVWGFQDFASGAESLLVFTHDPRENPTGGEIGFTFTNGVGTPSDSRVHGQTLDTWSLGYNRRSRKLGVSVVAVRRSVRRVVAQGTDTTGAFIWGNPGYGAMSHFPKMSRTYDALEWTAEYSGLARSWFNISYVLSRTRGNYPGLFGSDWRLGFSNIGPMFILPEQYVNGTGLLPNDRTHLFKAFGSRQFAFGISIGASLIAASGTPLTEYGAISLPAPFRGFASTRGTAGRTPAIWDLSLRTSYDAPLFRQSALRPRILLDIQHIGSPRKAVDFEQLLYTCLDDSGRQACVSASYGRVLQYQPPMSARVGAVIAFR